MTSNDRGGDGPGADHRLTAEHLVLMLLAESSSVEEAMPRILSALCEFIGWDLGAFLTVDYEHNCLRCVHTWPRPGSPKVDDAFLAAIHEARPVRGDGLAGSVWETGTAAGSANAIAFPIVVNDQVAAVMQFFSREPRAIGALLSQLEAAGRQIGAASARQVEHDELSKLFNLSLEMLCVCGFDGYMKRLNPAWERTLGYTEAELRSRPYLEFVHPDDIEPTLNTAKRLFEGETIVHFENRYFHKDGTPRWLLWAAAPPLPGQQVVYGAARDITERKAAETLRARTANLELLDELLNTLVDSGDLRDIFGRVSAIASKVLTHDAAALIVKLPDSRHARVYASAGFPPGLPDSTELSPELLEHPHWEHDILDDLTQLSDPRYQNLVRMGFNSLVRVPLRLEGRFAGALFFCSKRLSAFEPADVLVARRVADRMAMSVARDREVAATKRATEATARAAQLEARVRALTEELDARTGYRRVIGESASWRQVLTHAAQAAATETTVLLLGESGTGKEVVARFLHRGSPRRDGPFVALNCAALPEQLLEAELFGYERGAYTGAVQSKPGQLEQAAGGTLFLDEVGEMSPSAQAKFLRVLQEREFQRLGGTRILRTDVRIVAATNRDLQRAMSTGGFREDLYYRLNVFAIRLPPLRDRRDDILPLSEAFLIELGRGLGRPPAGISRDARQLLLDYHWPGNVRELRNILERAAILADGSLIASEHLAIVSPSAPASPGVAAPQAPAIERSAAASTAPPDLPTRSAGNLHDMERGMIEQALQNARFNKSKAAKELGLTRHQLYVRMKKYGFEYCEPAHSTTRPILISSEPIGSV